MGPHISRRIVSFITTPSLSSNRLLPDRCLNLGARRAKDLLLAIRDLSSIHGPGVRSGGWRALISVIWSSQGAYLTTQSVNMCDFPRFRLKVAASSLETGLPTVLRRTAAVSLLLYRSKESVGASFDGSGMKINSPELEK